jgi:hypothetical protein
MNCGDPLLCTQWKIAKFELLLQPFLAKSEQSGGDIRDISVISKQIVDIMKRNRTYGK